MSNMEYCENRTAEIGNLKFSAVSFQRFSFLKL